VSWATNALCHDDTTVSALARHLGVDWHTLWDAVEVEASGRLDTPERLAGCGPRCRRARLAAVAARRGRAGEGKAAAGPATRAGRCGARRDVERRRAGSGTRGREICTTRRPDDSSGRSRASRRSVHLRTLN
jgi:hypothetical protein